MPFEGYMMLFVGLLTIIAIVQEFYLDKRCKKDNEKRG